ncbi:PrsW family glutamic-type intramembrane protease [Sphingomicrobium nitratireducens]|uniref:PrsW family glutamic-type intramembrane protease n=1 Tax=Sphingomicrobium nitratireducens TaxID=2964666 RepID=UPI00224012E5|nr:PrsW family glutamic-type intramembrane protease [Sphingomicrobium nitratireducens]
MILDLAIKALLGCAPVLIFLGALTAFDSFKLVRVSTVATVMLAGMAASFMAYVVNTFLMEKFAIDYVTYSHFGGPVVEEILKVAVIAWYIRTDRVGFAFDAAIIGFAAGTGFAVIENLFYLGILGQENVALWTVRGFGTAIMHGATAMVFATMSHGMSVRADKAGLREFFPGLALAILAHGLFNNLLGDRPMMATLIMMLALPAMLSVLLKRDEKSIDEWIAFDFAAHERMLHDLKRGNYVDGSLGHFLDEVEERFGEFAKKDVEEYLELHIKLVLAAEHLLERHHKGDMKPPASDVEEELRRLHEIEGELGRATLLALRPHLHFTRKELWDIYYLEREENMANPHAH